MFSKILIANRGEIACRVIRTARRLGIGTVAVYSDADAAALHVEMADEAVRIGPPPASESYLCGDRIIEAARQAGAEAIHPGYGFLSENPDFVEAVERAGLVFIGPSAKAIRAMGLKDSAKRLMERAKVPVVPGYHGDAQDLVVLAGKANDIGFPVLIKATAGGGGKGMRRVDRPEDFAEALSAARREARSAFGDDRVLVEKFVESPRHIEVQVFGDSHGNAIHLYERDCSLQRRHQKVVEEAPAPGMTEEMRRAMGEAAVTAAKAIGYSGAGTIEFIVDASEGLRPDRFWFMEMNTRLQVEHPVTEAVTGLDLVEWQLRVAAGGPLPLRQEHIAIRGHSVEVRLYAEDPARGFLPATGGIAHLAFPDSVRVDAGVRTGDALTPFYDPLMAKLIAHGATRDEALAGLGAALAGTEVAGVVTNLPFLRRLLAEPSFAAGDVDTGLIDRALPELVSPSPIDPRALVIAAVVASGMTAFGGTDPFEALGPWQLWGEPVGHVDLGYAGLSCRCTVARNGTDEWTVTGSGEPEPVTLRLRHDADGAMTAQFGTHRLSVRSIRRKGALTIFLGGRAYDVRLPEELHRAEEARGTGDVVAAPMPGLVKQVLVSPKAEVVRGQAVVIMEAMKMEMSLNAPRDGVVEEVLAEAGGQVDEGAVLVRLGERSADA
ncbi:MAG: acetyl/propionyl/methylcrotonyl-CoA carboxylase subunit alpha [Pararhizobium sp.]